MSVTKDDLYKIIDRLSESDTASAYDYLQYLIERKKQRKQRNWDDLSQLPPDEDPLNEEELRQLKASDDYIPLEKAIKEYGI